jgi:hypothetical protein
MIAPGNGLGMPNPWSFPGKLWQQYEDNVAQRFRFASLRAP